MLYKINKSKCTGCQVCIANCLGVIRIGADGKAEIVDQEKLEQCGGENICPIGAIERINKERKSETEILSQPTPQPLPSYQPKPSSGRGMGAGRGSGFGKGPRDGRGGGRGGGGKTRASKNPIHSRY